MGNTSSTLASTFITDIRSVLNESASVTNPFWTDAEFLVWLNKAIIDVTARSKCTETTESIVLVQGQVEYILSTSYIDVVGVFYNDGNVLKGLQQRKIKDVGLSEYSTTPLYWYEWNGKVGIYPVADLTAEGTEVTVYLIPKPVAVTSTDLIPTPACFDELLILFVTARAWRKDSQPGKASEVMTEYIATVDRFRGDFTAKPKEVEDNG